MSIDKSIKEKVVQVIRNQQESDDAWVDLARIGAPLTDAGISYKDRGFLKLRSFLNELNDVLEFDEKQTEGKTPVYYVRIRSESVPKFDDNSFLVAEDKSSPSLGITPYVGNAQKEPTSDSWLFDWAFVDEAKICTLSQLALAEKWYYGTQAPDRRNLFPILHKYLAYTFKRLAFEQKILLKEDTSRKEEYAAFNTGLVDRKYEDIYALFKKNTKYRDAPYWYLLDFVVAGEDTGKTLVSLFNPLPSRANYFGDRIENMLYDTSTGELSCDYTHILTEHMERLPLEFLQDNCSPEFLSIDGIRIEDIYSTPKEEKRRFFDKLGEKVRQDSRTLNRLKNRLNDAVDLALKRVEWNYKTAIPMYNPSQNCGSLLLPLALVDGEHVDLALVVTREQSGNYQGQTVLTLDMAYSNSRLITRPDSDWLQTDTIFSPQFDDGENAE